ncbi:MAG: DUF2117 domain-containing protein [Methanopyri archaeon]|nr:DUF2117 domain-containing protein [Methanopyri archaeon]
MRIGLVFHGPTIFDTGWARRVLDALKGLSRVEAELGGTTGYMAMLDAGMEDEVRFERRMPSECLRALRDRCDALVLANHGKSLESGLRFAEVVMRRAGVPSLVQVERPGEEDGGLILWNPDDVHRRVGEYLSEVLDLPVLMEREPSKRDDVRVEGGRVLRRIAAVEPGDLILVNGVTVGVAEDDDVVLVFEDGRLVDAEGARLKPEGVQRLGKVDPERAVVKTDSRLRRTEPDREALREPPGSIRRIVLVNHDAEARVKDIEWADAVVSVGDDTTCVCAELAARLGSWLVGLVDLDVDGWFRDDTREVLLDRPSVLALLVCDVDDEAGKAVRESLFGGGDRVTLPFPVEPPEFVEVVKGAAGDHVLRVLKGDPAGAD